MVTLICTLKMEKVKLKSKDAHAVVSCWGSTCVQVCLPSGHVCSFSIWPRRPPPSLHGPRTVCTPSCPVPRGSHVAQTRAHQTSSVRFHTWTRRKRVSFTCNVDMGLKTPSSKQIGQCSLAWLHFTLLMRRGGLHDYMLKMWYVLWEETHKWKKRQELREGRLAPCTCG